MARIRSAWGQVRPNGGGGTEGWLAEFCRGAGDGFDATLEPAGDATEGSTGL